MSRFRIALVTGASSGIGRAMAVWWARRGVTVLAAARRVDRLQALADEHDTVVPVELDVSRAAEAAAAIQALDDEHGGIDLVVANAGVGGPTPADRATWADVESVLAVNVYGAAATVTALLPRMVERGRGHVVGVSSCARHAGLGAYSCYSASKAFLSIFLQSVRVDLTGTGVGATCIEPGFVKSEMSAELEGHAPMPFIAETADAVEVYCRAVERGARSVAYPRLHTTAARALGWIPGFVYEPLARRASEPQRALFAGKGDALPPAKP